MSTDEGIDRCIDEWIDLYIDECINLRWLFMLDTRVQLSVSGL